MKKLIFLIPIILLCSCMTKEPFTGEFVKRNRVDSSTIADVQFYVSHKFKLKRVYDTTVTKNHVLVTTVRKEKIKIKKHTPCAVEGFNSNNTELQVTFNDNGRMLTFISRRGGDYTIKTRKGLAKYGEDKFELFAKDDIVLLCKMSRHNRKDSTKKPKGKKL